MNATLEDVLSVKGGSVQSISGEQSVLDAVNQMHRQNIGALLVLEDGVPEGIFTERDVLLRVVNEGLDPGTTRVAEVMTGSPYCVPTGMTVRAALEEITERRIRHLPVVDDGKLVGLVSNGDLNRYVVTHLREEVRELSRDVEKEGFKLKAVLALLVVFAILALIAALIR